MPRKNKIEQSLSAEQLPAFLEDLRKMPFPTLAKIQQLVKERFGVEVSLMGAKAFRDKTLDGYIARLQRNSELATAVAQAREQNPGATLADAAGDLLSREVFDFLNANADVAEKLAELAPHRLAAVIKSLRGEDRKSEAMRLAHEKYQDTVRAAKAEIEKTLVGEKKRGGLGKETVERIEAQLKLM